MCVQPCISGHLIPQLNGINTPVWAVSAVINHQNISRCLPTSMSRSGKDEQMIMCGRRDDYGEYLFCEAIIIADTPTGILNDRTQANNISKEIPVIPLLIQCEHPLRVDCPLDEQLIFTPEW